MPGSQRKVTKVPKRVKFTSVFKKIRAALVRTVD